MDERSPGIPADCLRDHLTGLIIPYSLETWLRVPETPPRHLSEYATYQDLARKIHDFRSTKGLAMVQIRYRRGFETKSEAFT